MGTCRGQEEEGRGAAPHPTHYPQSGDNASPGPLPPLPRRAGPPKECGEAPFCTPAPTRSSGGREGSCWGGAVAGSPSSLPWAPERGQRLQVDTAAEHPERRARAFCSRPPPHSLPGACSFGKPLPAHPALQPPEHPPQCPVTPGVTLAATIPTDSGLRPAGRAPPAQSSRQDG